MAGLITNLRRFPLTTQVDDKTGALQAELDRARAAHIQAQEELTEARRDYRACAQRGDGEGMAAAWRQSQELPHVILGARIGAMQAEIAVLEPQAEAAYQAELERARELEDEIRHLPHGRLFPDSPPHVVQRMVAVREAHGRAQQANRTVQGRLTELRRELGALLLRSNIDH
jgi:hypothetical protein